MIYLACVFSQLNSKLYCCYPRVYHRKYTVTWSFNPKTGWILGFRIPTPNTHLPNGSASVRHLFQMWQTAARERLRYHGNVIMDQSGYSLCHVRMWRRWRPRWHHKWSELIDSASYRTAVDIVGDADFHDFQSSKLRLSVVEMISIVITLHLGRQCSKQ